jgi:hypothetical protein
VRGLVVGGFLTLLRALFPAARAGELVGLSARGFVEGSTHPLARWLAEAEGVGGLVKGFGGWEVFDALPSSRLGRLRGRVSWV